MLVLISLYPCSMVLGHATKAHECLLIVLETAATSRHGSAIAIYAAYITQVVAVQLSIKLCADAGGLKGVDLFTRHGAVLLQGLCISLPGHSKRECCIAVAILEKHLQAKSSHA